MCCCWWTLLQDKAAAFCTWGVPASINGCFGHSYSFITDVIYLDWHHIWKSLLFPFCTPVRGSLFLAALKVVLLSANDSERSSYLLKKSHQETFLSVAKIIVFASQFFWSKETWYNNKKGKSDWTQILIHLKSKSYIFHKKYCGESSFISCAIILISFNSYFFSIQEHKTVKIYCSLLAFQQQIF